MSEEESAATPHPDECDHKWILKGGAGRVWFALYQCEHCGLARKQRIKNVDNPIFEGWNPKPEPEPEEDDGGWFS